MAGRRIEARVRRQRWSLLVSVLLALLLLGVTVVLLLSAASEFLPDVPGLNYRWVQAGLLALLVVFGIYTIDRDRRLRRLNEHLIEERMETARLRAIDDMKTAFMRALSHDLRTPLTSILTAAGLLRRHRDKLPPELVEEALGTITAQAGRLDGMLSDLLDIDRLERGLVEPRRRLVDLGEVVREAMAEIAPVDHPLSVDGDGIQAAVDVAQVRRILDNLVSNAAKHTPPGTPIRVLVSEHAEPPGALLVVEDEGPGIPEEEKQELFEAFRRGADAADRDGSGLGLHLVAKFAELHGGRAWVEDRPGGGASFRVLFPDRRAARG